MKTLREFVEDRLKVAEDRLEKARIERDKWMEAKSDVDKGGQPSFSVQKSYRDWRSMQPKE
jgi:hypothetical protein